MWAYEALSDQRPRGGTTLTVPTVSENKGDFSELLALGSSYQIYDPYSIAPAAGGLFSRQPLAGNRIPQSQINPLGARIAQLFDFSASLWRAIKAMRSKCTRPEARAVPPIGRLRSGPHRKPPAIPPRAKTRKES